MTCKHCNTPLEDQARFCVYCGAPVTEPQEDQSPQPVSSDATQIGLVPKRVDNPIRFPKRPAPAQPVILQQDGGEQETGNEQSLSKNNEDNKPVANAADVPLDTADEQPTISFPIDTATTADVSKEDSVLYEQPTVIVSLNSIRDEEIAPVTPDTVPTLPFEIQRVPHPELVEAEEAKEPEETENRAVELSSSEYSQPLLYYQLNTTTKGSYKLPAVVNRTEYTPRRRRGCGGCALGGLSALLVLLLIVAAIWIFALRPYVHNTAQGELDNALTSAVNQLPAQAKQLPPGSTIPVNENTINNLIVLNLAPSNPVQHPTTTISGQNVRLDFQLYNFPCAVTMVPTLNKGQLVVSKVSIEGIFSTIMSPEEMTNLLNKHLNDAQSRLQRTFNNVQLKDHEVDLTLV
jgi:hypothetical protein